MGGNQPKVGITRLFVMIYFDLINLCEHATFRINVTYFPLHPKSTLTERQLNSIHVRAELSLLTVTMRKIKEKTKYDGYGEHQRLDLSVEATLKQKISLISQQLPAGDESTF